MDDSNIEALERLITSLIAERDTALASRDKAHIGLLRVAEERDLWRNIADDLYEACRGAARPMLALNAYLEARRA